MKQHKPPQVRLDSQPIGRDDIKDRFYSYIQNKCVWIERADGGAVLHSGEDSEVFKFDEDDPSGLQDMLFRIKELFINDSRYSKFRVQTLIRHGDKYECKDPKCKICEDECL